MAAAVNYIVAHVAAIRNESPSMLFINLNGLAVPLKIQFKIWSLIDLICVLIIIVGVFTFIYITYQLGQKVNNNATIIFLMIFTVHNDCEGEVHLLDCKKSQRSCTDLHHLFLFGLFLTLWIGIAIHAYTAGRQPFDCIQEKDLELVFSQLTKCRSVCALFIWLAILFLGLYFIVIRFLTKYVIYTTIFMKLVLLSLPFITFLILRSIVSPFVIATITVCFVFCGLALYTLKKVGYRTVCTIIQESCKAMVCHPSSIVIVFIYSVLMELVGYFSFCVIFGLLTIPKVRESSPSKYSIDPPDYVFFLLFAFVSCSLWVMRLIYNVGRTILYGIFSTWYQTVDKTTTPRTISLRVTHAILRYHFGTLTFGSTIFTIIQIIRTMYNRWVDLYRKFKANKISIFCFLVVLANATSNTLVACANYGTSYYHSMYDSFKLLMQNPLKFAAIRLMTDWMIFFGAVLIPGLTLCFASLYIFPNSDYYDIPGIPVITIAIGSILIVAILLETFHAATTAILYCFLEDLSSKQIESDYNEDIITDGSTGDV